MKLPGYPTTREGWRLRANAEEWEFVSEKSRGRGGLKFSYVPPQEIMELIEKRLRGDLPPAEPRPSKHLPPSDGAFPAAPQFQYQSQGNAPLRSYGVSEPGPYDVNSEINAHLLWLCHDACLQVHGEAFSKVSVQVQIDYAVDLYNLLLRLSAAKRGNTRSDPGDFKGLDAEDVGSQLRIFLQMGWAKSFPPPNLDPNQLVF